MGGVENCGRGQAEGGWGEAGQVLPSGADWPVDVVVGGVGRRGGVGLVVRRGGRGVVVVVRAHHCWRSGGHGGLQLCVSLVWRVVRAGADGDSLDVLVCLSLEDLQVSPEDVPHEERGAADEVLFVHGTELLPRHGEAGDETVDVRAAAQGELSDGPGQPVSHMVLRPVSRVPGDPQALPHPVPGPVGGLEHVTDALHITGLGLTVGWGGHLRHGVVRLFTVLLLDVPQLLDGGD